MPRAKQLPFGDAAYYFLSRDRHPIRLHDGTLFYDRVVVGVDRLGWPEIMVTLGVEQRWPVVNRVVIERRKGGPEFSADALRSIPWGQVKDDVIEAVARLAAHLADAEAAGLRADAHFPEASEFTRRRRHPYTPERLAQVAEAARTNPKHPVVAIRDAFDISYRHAGRLHEAAKKAGLLPEAAEEA